MGWCVVLLMEFEFLEFKRLKVVLLRLGLVFEVKVIERILLLGKVLLVELVGEGLVNSIIVEV